MEEWFTINEMADRLNIPHQTLRRYMANHKHLLRVRKQHKAYQLHAECEDVLKRMRELYSSGKTTEEVDDILTRSGLPVIIDVENEEGEREKAEIGAILAEMNAKIDGQGKHIEELTEVLKRQSQALTQHQEYIRESLERRDKLLLESIRESQRQAKETQLLIAASQERENEKKTWWQRLFKQDKPAQK